MTKLTIQLDWKNYELPDGTHPLIRWLILGTFQWWIEESAFVELQPQEEKPEETLYGRSIDEQINAHKLTKLRAELERSNYQMDNGQFRNDLAIEILDLVEKEPCDCDMCKTRRWEDWPWSDEKWSPKPWDLIEVSNDWEMWEKRVFSGRVTWDYNFVVRTEKSNDDIYFKYARPLAPEELKLPDFDWLKLCRESEERWGEWLLWSAVGYQLEAITKYLQRVNLISKR